jgi:hypothetical protein
VLNIRHAGTKLLLGDIEVEACKIHVLAARENWLMVFPEGQRPPMVDEILYSDKQSRWGAIPEEYRMKPQWTVAEYLLWLPKYGHLATFAESDALVLLNSRLPVYTGDTVGLRAKQTAMTKVFVTDYDDVPQPFEVTQGLQQPVEREIYRVAMSAWQRTEEHDYMPLERALKGYVESKGKKLYPAGRYWV